FCLFGAVVLDLTRFGLAITQPVVEHFSESCVLRIRLSHLLVEVELGYFKPSIGFRHAGITDHLAALVPGIVVPAVQFLSFLCAKPTVTAPLHHFLSRFLVTGLPSLIIGLGGTLAKHSDRKSTRLNSSHVAISYAV